MILCLDPSGGKSGATGAALFTPSGTLQSVKLVPGVSKVPLENARNAAHELVRWLEPYSGSLTELLVEWPVIRRGSKTNPNHLLGLAATAGAVAAIDSGFALTTTLPEGWKGNLPKAVFTKRIYKRLTEAERALVDEIKPASLRHNVLDAVGLGLWYFKRLEPKRVYPR